MCDQPHPVTVKHMLGQCLGGDVAAAARTVRSLCDAGYVGDEAEAPPLPSKVRSLWDAGYAASDIIGTIFKVCRNYDEAAMPEALKLEFLREIGFCHMRIADGCDTCAAAGARARARPRASATKLRPAPLLRYCQLAGLVAKLTLCKDPAAAAAS